MTITMTIKKKWFDKIKSGEKTVEYREAKPYWQKRITWIWHRDSDPFYYSIESIIFKNGYRKDSPKIMADVSAITYMESGLKTDLKIDKPVYAIHLKNVREI